MKICLSLILCTCVPGLLAFPKNPNPKFPKFVEIQSKSFIITQSCSKAESLFSQFHNFQQVVLDIRTGLSINTSLYMHKYGSPVSISLACIQDLIYLPILKTVLSSPRNILILLHNWNLNPNHLRIYRIHKTRYFGY